MKNFLLVFMTLLAPTMVQAKLKIITTTTDLAAVTREVGGENVEVESIVKGTQDPHYVEAKPSFMTKANRADLVISIGLGLEVGWLPSILRGARNPKILSGPGNLEVGPLVQPIEIPSGTMSRSQGDVHPEGNPHVMLDPNRVGTIAEKIAERLGQLDESGKKVFSERAKNFRERLSKKESVWRKRVLDSGVKNVVTYHRALNYFLSTFGVQTPIVLEPKPGIPPTSGHILEVMKVIKEKKITLVLVENFFDHTIANRIKEEIPSVRIVSVPASVEGEPNIKNPEELFERLVQIIEGK